MGSAGYRGGAALFGLIALVMGRKARGKPAVVAGTPAAGMAQALGAAGTLAGNKVELKE